MIQTGPEQVSPKFCSTSDMQIPSTHCTHTTLHIIILISVDDTGL